jgi:hypothetical protein
MLGKLDKGIKMGLYHMSYTSTNSKWIKYLNIRLETTKTHRRKHREKSW